MAKNSRLVGVLGGMGPAATVAFMQRVIDLTPAARDQDHIHLLVDQDPTTANRQEAILGEGPSPAPALAAMAVRLARAGADFLVMPCNTAHAFKADIVRAAKLPFLSIVAATVDELPSNMATIGILETPACKRAGLYQDAFAGTNRTLESLNDNACAEVMRIAYALKRGERDPGHRFKLQSLVADLLARGAQAIIVACTEIPLILKSEDVDVPLISTIDALAIRTIDVARGDRPLPPSN